ncbi:MAG: UDP-N-acetylglucosamine 2-epimerase (non-hydrolyzing) [Bryobacteraceae bacterium]|nr:UDP-N-acetylglucosamine 2-epimerase (non-hydrolyzing) [Bryobacteraceae bacterium]MDW8379205.1 UDP-N-acetylglucosamine 2-epimerase (non-hydrolyzing) [Bryobacterales bacterium]
MRKVLFVFGTRPEAIKLAPVILHLRQRPEEFETRVCVTAQHRHLLDQVLGVFGLAPDYDLDLMLPGQTLFQSTSRILTALEPVLTAERPDCVLVQGDTTSTFCGALAAFYLRIPVGHVEAGLRTWDLYQPFPEEANRLLTGRLATWHFAPTPQSRENLLSERVPADRIVVTGNTGIDALFYVRGELESGRLRAPSWPWLDPSKKLILVTGHRRENFGQGFEEICQALQQLSERQDVQIVYPVHPNPNVQQPVYRILAGRKNVHLIEPLDYVPFVDLMRRCRFLLTDSGGVQEEAPSFGKPVLVMREKTERPEAVEAGTATLVGADAGRILTEAARLLDDETEYERRSKIHNPFGDGMAAPRIAQALEQG